MTNQPVQGSYAPVNGLNMYYETYGTGKPLILIHGGFGMVGMFAELLPVLAESRQVIAVELQGHGHTANRDRPFSFESLADDIAALIKHLGLDNADVCGYSLGGGAAWQTAIRHPEVVRKLIIISAPCKRQGWYPGVLAGMAAVSVEGMSATPIYGFYQAVAPNAADWPALVNNTRELLGKEYDWSQEVSALKMPVLILIGDGDSVRTAHAVEMFELLGGGKVDGQAGGMSNSQLAIFPATTHFTIINRIDLLRPIMTAFLDAPLPKAG